MTALETRARDALKELRELSPTLQPSVDSATAAMDGFMSIHVQLCALSRRNSNVHSLALSLGQKRLLAATCEASLIVLRDQLAKHTFAATR